METLMEEMYTRIRKSKEALIAYNLQEFLGREPNLDDMKKVSVVKDSFKFNKEWYQYNGKTFGYYWSGFDNFDLLKSRPYRINIGFVLEKNKELDRKIAEEKQAQEENIRLPKYNPDFIKGKPKEAGWYLAARRSNDVKENYYIIQAWFNPVATPNWWIGGGYVSNKSEPLEWQEKVIAYAPIPEYKL